MRYAIVIENADNNFSAYVPDLPGCVSTGQTLAEVRKNIKDAVDFHLEACEKTVNWHRSLLQLASTSSQKSLRWASQ